MRRCWTNPRTKRSGSAHRTAMAREIQGVAAAQQLLKGSHVVAHGAVRGRHDRGRPSHHMIAGEQDVLLGESEGEMVGAMAGRRHGLQRKSSTGRDHGVAVRRAAMAGLEVDGRRPERPRQ